LHPEPKDNRHLLELRESSQNEREIKC